MIFFFGNERWFFSIFKGGGIWFHLENLGEREGGISFDKL